MSLPRLTKAFLRLPCCSLGAVASFRGKQQRLSLLVDVLERHQLCRHLSTIKPNLAPANQSRTQEGASSDTSDIPSAFGHLLLIIPAAAFCLGTWQVKRRKWKLNLIRDMEMRTTAPPVALKSIDTDDLAALEYQRVKVRGEFDHSKEVLILPRTLNKPPQGDAGSLISRGEPGAHVVTPFYCPDLGVSILVNRGFVSKSLTDPAKRQRGQISGEIELVGLVRKTEKRAAFMPKNDTQRGRWHYLDLEEMSKVTGAEPVMIDADSSCDIPGGPIGGQSRVTLRNEHLQYMITWYSLSFLTGLMWFFGIYKKRRMLSKPAL
ncbi:surfeit locus protein 1-like [Asterias rubens]|uniref:surfeit locus protein 1-like n=1 Tax=Asterias rubens TaxID=7604 RepID=UPI001455AD93|nr:surfeit locus protein 1-like [Asterias rubens]XP_033643203.1 surfeit locus protein 1-like [Asterias rubens]